MATRRIPHRSKTLMGSLPLSPKTLARRNELVARLRAARLTSAGKVPANVTAALNELAGMAVTLMQKRAKGLSKPGQQRATPYQQHSVILTEAEQAYDTSDGCAKYNTYLGALATLFGFCSDFDARVYVVFKGWGISDKENPCTPCKPE